MQERLELRGELAELGRVSPWVKKLAGRYSIPEKTAFAIDLCLEEALSNIVRHGYSGMESRPITVEFRIDGGSLTFTIKDEAPHFPPPEHSASMPESLDQFEPGGLGIPLMRRFADRVEWEPLPNGNRLTLQFAR